MFDLPPPRHIPTLPTASVRSGAGGRSTSAFAPSPPQVSDLWTRDKRMSAPKVHRALRACDRSQVLCTGVNTAVE